MGKKLEIQKRMAAEALATFKMNQKVISDKQINTYMDRFTTIEVPSKYRNYVKDESFTERTNKLIRKSNDMIKDFDVFFCNGWLVIFDNR